MPVLVMRVILFDIDGTLIRTGGAGVKAFARASELVFGIPGGTDHLNFHGRTDTSLIREYLEFHGLEVSQSHRERFLQAYLVLLAEQLNSHAGETCPGVAAFLHACRSLTPSPLIGLLTGNVRLGAELKLRAHGLWEEFSIGGFGDDDEDRNRIAVIAHSRSEQAIGTNIPGDQVLVIGDTERDVACARAIGARCLAVATGGVSEADLARSGPDWLVSTLEQVHPEELRSGDARRRPSAHKTVSQGFLV
jgi:phosphoglycolate phosphatase